MYCSNVHYLGTFTCLQQQEVLSELYSYSHQTPAPRDSFSTKLTLSYLEACNKIFERGLLSHDKVTSSDCQVVLNIQEGYQFFIKWLDEIYEKGVLCDKCVYIIIMSVCVCTCTCVCMCVCVCDIEYELNLCSCR